MSYVISNSRGQIIAVVQDGTVNTTATSQTLVGKNVTPYGEYEVENLVHQLENFANTTPPGNPIEGQIWYNTSASLLNVYSGTAWTTVSGITSSTSAPNYPVVSDIWFNPNTQQIRVYSPVNTGYGWVPSNKLTVATSAPSALVSGEMYFNSNTSQLFVYDGTNWDLIGPQAVSGFAATSWTSTTLLDTGSVAHAVIVGYVNGDVVSIVSNDAFTILSSQRPTGFVSLVPGINLATGYTLSGTASKATQLATARTINGVAFDGTSNIVIGNDGSMIAGNYLIGDDYDGIASQTWSVDATTGNAASKIVARDSNGDFAARTVTANLVGNVSGYATNITGVASTANGGTGYSEFTEGQILIGSDTGELAAAYVSGSGPIEVSSSGNGIVISYAGGTGTGNVTYVGITPGSGIGVSGSPITSAGNITVTNTGVTRLDAGSGITVNRVNGDVTVTNAGVTRLQGGNGIAVSTATGNITLNNTGVTSIIAGDNITINRANGEVTINSTGGGGSAYTLPTASSSILGGVKVGSGLAINAGVLSATGVSKVVAGPGISISPTNGLGEVTISGYSSYSLPVASGGTLGGIKVGSGLAINGAGVLSTTGGGGTGTVYSVTAGSGLTGGTITTAGTMAVDSTVLRTTGTQSISGLKQYTGGITSQAYNFTLTGNSIFYADAGFPAYQEPVVQIAVDNFYAHQFYKKRFIVEGTADATTPGSNRPVGAAIIGIDNGNTGGAGVGGWHTQAEPGLGMGVWAYASNAAFTGAMFQSLSARPNSNNFVHIRCYSTQGNPVFVVNGSGYVSADGTYTSPAADYAEYFEWSDGNPNAEDRTGTTVALVGNKIRVAQEGDTVIGVVSANPSMVGDAAELNWNGKYLRDDWGRVIQETYHAYQWIDEDGRPQSKNSFDTSDVVVPDDAVMVTEDGLGNPLMRSKPNPDYDESATYVPRSQRSEWAPVGLLGKLRVRVGQVLGDRWIKLRNITDSIEEYLVK